MSQFIFPPLTASLDSEQTNGGSLPAKQMVMAGFDSTATRALLTDSSGRLEINAVVSLPLPSGAATAALQTAGNNLLTTIDADTSLLSGAVKNIQSAQGTTDAGLPAIVVRNDTVAEFLLNNNLNTVITDKPMEWCYKAFLAKQVDPKFADFCKSNTKHVKIGKRAIEAIQKHHWTQGFYFRVKSEKYLMLAKIAAGTGITKVIKYVSEDQLA